MDTPPRFPLHYTFLHPHNTVKGSDNLLIKGHFLTLCVGEGCIPPPLTLKSHPLLSVLYTLRHIHP